MRSRLRPDVLVGATFAIALGFVSACGPLEPGAETEPPSREAPPTASAHRGLPPEPRLDEAFADSGDVCGDGGDTCAPPRLLTPHVGHRTGSAHAANETGRVGPRQPTFTWAAVGGATEYQIQIDADHDPSSAARSATVSGLSYTEPELIGQLVAPVGGTYFWRVRARWGSGPWGAWSPDRRIEVGRLSDDVNGDGRADLVVGAPGENGEGHSEGRVYVFHGMPADLPSTAVSRLLDIPSLHPQARFGHAVALVDLDGDGYTDALVGAPGRGFGAGEVAIHYGGPGGLASMAGVRIAPPVSETGAGFGSAIAPAGDVDADGYEDVWISAPKQDVQIIYGGRFVKQTDVGAAYLYRGGSRSAQQATPVLSRSGGAPHAAFGETMVAVGDLDQDGISELAFGAPGRTTDAGAVVVYRGGLTPAVIATAPVVLSFGGSVNFGRALAGGDFDGDGRRDLAVGCDGPTPLFVYRGNAVGGLDLWYAPLVGWPGVSALAASDVDRDGDDELAVGYALDGGGRVVILGGGSATMTTLASWAGPQAGARVGASVAWVDAQGDARADLFVGAPRHDGPTADQGRVHAWPMLGTGIALGTPARDYTPLGNHVSGSFGWAVR